MSRGMRIRPVLLGSSLTIAVCGMFTIPPAFCQTQVLPSKPVWQQAPTESLDQNIPWSAVENFGDVPTQFQPIPSKVDPKELAAKPRVEGPYKSRGIYGFGAGVRPGTYTGDPTNALFTARIAYKLDQNFSVSLRPSILIDYDDNNNSNNNNDDNGGWELRVPLTFDLFNRSFITPFFGGGIATNVDGLGYTDGMLTAGVDLNITKWLTIGSHVNYIYQTNIDDTDWEVLSMLYLRF
jgi:hypothetical protein